MKRTAQKDSFSGELKAQSTYMIGWRSSVIAVLTAQI